MGQLSVEAEGTTQASSEIVWSLVADANTYPHWGPWNDGGYRPAASGPSQQGQIQWFRYGRTTSVEKILEVEETCRVVYTVESGLPVKNYRAEVTLTPTPSHGTAICWRATWDNTLMGKAVRRRLQRFYRGLMADLVMAADRNGTLPQ